MTEIDLVYQTRLENPEKLIHNVKNAATHSEGQIALLANAFKKFGFIGSVIVGRDNVILAGHGRVLAALKAGMPEIPVTDVSHLTDDEQAAYMIAENKLAELKGWDQEVLDQEITRLTALDFDLGDLGFIDDVVTEFNGPGPREHSEEPGKQSEDEQWETDDDEDGESREERYEAAERDDDIDEKPEPVDAPIPFEVPARVTGGSAWRLGKHILVCGNSSDASTVHKFISEESAHSIVTDPPYGISFMGKEWDHGVPSSELWKVWFSRVTPGAHILSFCATRMYHHMAMNIENAGFSPRDMISWMYGSGMPKSMNISKAIDKAAGVEREVLGLSENARPNRVGKQTKLSGLQTIGGEITMPQTASAKQWEGFGTGLKPAHENILYGVKPYGVRVFVEQTAQYLRDIICQSLSHAKVVKKLSTSSLSELQTADDVDSVLCNAVRKSNTLGDLLAAMDTFQCTQETENTSLNIAKSWLLHLEEICLLVNTSTIETVSKTTTVWKTLNSYLSQITPDSITVDATNLNGKPSNAAFVDGILNDLKTFYAITQGLSVTGIAIAKEVENYQADRGKLGDSKIMLARKPHTEPTIAKNVQRYGTGGLNIDGSRVGTETIHTLHTKKEQGTGVGWHPISTGEKSAHSGRWPANVILSHADGCVEVGVKKVKSDGHHSYKHSGNKDFLGNLGDLEDKGNPHADEDGTETVEDWQCVEDCPVRILDEQSGVSKSKKIEGGSTRRAQNEQVTNPSGWVESNRTKKTEGHDDSGGASRFFYVPKPSRSDKSEGNNHATVKPVRLMQYLIKLITPPGGIVLEPFAGSGTTLLAAERLHMKCIAFELDPHHCDIIIHRFETMTGVAAVPYTHDSVFK